MNLDLTDPTVIAIAVGSFLIVVIALMAFMFRQTHAATGARPTFGPSYMRTLARTPDGKPEPKLTHPENRLEKTQDS